MHFELPNLKALVYFYPTENYIDGVEFVSLTLPEIKEMVPPIGLAKKIVKLIPKVCMYIDVPVCFCNWLPL